MAAVTIDSDKANLSTETLGFTILDLKLRDFADIGVCQKYIEAYGPQRLLLEVLRASV